MGLGLRNGVTDPNAYARSAFEGECAIVASTGHGRNDQLNKSAFTLGQLIGAGALERDEVEHGLFEAARASGYLGKDGPSETRATIKSGLDRGVRVPRAGLNGSADTYSFTRPQPKLDDVPVPDWTPPDAENKPKFFAAGKELPSVFGSELRRHVYYRDGKPVRVKAKNKQDQKVAWSNFYRVRRPSDGVVGWQARKPECFIPVPYIGPPDAPNPFDVANDGSPLIWAEGEKDVDTLRRHGLLAFTFGSASDVPDCADLLQNRHVVLAADNDAAGERSVLRRADSIKDSAASVRIVRFKDLGKEGADATDFFEGGGTAEEFIGRAEAFEQPTNAEAPPDDPEDAVARVLERFNQRYMIVNEDGKAVVFQPGFEPVLKRRFYHRLMVRDLLTLHMNERMVVDVTEKGKPIIKTSADIWLSHPHRKQYLNGVTFDPTGKHQNGVLNLWEGFAVEPQPGDWSLLREHMRDVICDGDGVRFDYLIGWIARMLQHPGQQGEVAVVMKGGEGSGKGTLAKALMRIVGHHGLAIANAKHLVGNFNAHLRDVIFLFADEAFFAGDKAHIGTLKSLITEPHLSLEGKFQNVALAANFLHIMMASNEEWVVPASLDARRFFVLEVPDSVRGDHGYFGRIWGQMDAGGYQAMLHDLLAYDLSTFNIRSVPATEGLGKQKKLSLQTPEAWWLDCLDRGYVFKSKIGLHEDFGQWQETVSTELLYASYLEFAKSRNERRPMIREHLGIFLKTLGARACQKRNAIVGEQMTDVRNNFGGVTRKAVPIKKEKATGYTFGKLAVARQAFLTACRIEHDWGEDNEDGDGGGGDGDDARQGWNEDAKGTHF